MLIKTCQSFCALQIYLYKQFRIYVLNLVGSQCSWHTIITVDFASYESYQACIVIELTTREASHQHAFLR